MPRPPTVAAPRSERMSPNMFSSTITSYCQGAWMAYMVMASMYAKSVRTPGKARAVSWKT